MIVNCTSVLQGSWKPASTEQCCIGKFTSTGIHIVPGREAIVDSVSHTLGLAQACLSELQTGQYCDQLRP